MADREGGKHVARDASRDDEPGDHHHPHDRGGRSALPVSYLLGQQDEERRSRCADPDADQRVGY